MGNSKRITKLFNTDLRSENRNDKYVYSSNSCNITKTLFYVWKLWERNIDKKIIVYIIIIFCIKIAKRCSMNFKKEHTYI